MEDSRYSFFQAEAVDGFLSSLTPQQESGSQFAVRILAVAQKGLFLSDADDDSSSENDLGGRSIS